MLLQANLYSYFCGQWRFTRDMQGGDGRLLGRAAGEAQFSPTVNADSLLYSESGQLHMQPDSRPISFSRRFLYRFDGWLMYVAFADGVQDGQEYQAYRYDPASQVLLAIEQHVCLLDHYNAGYRLSDADNFDLHTRIEGPHKDYQLRTHFTRVTE